MFNIRIELRDKYHRADEVISILLANNATTAKLDGSAIEAHFTDFDAMIEANAAVEDATGLRAPSSINHTKLEGPEFSQKDAEFGARYGSAGRFEKSIKVPKDRPKSAVLMSDAFGVLAQENAKTPAQQPSEVREVTGGTGSFSALYNNLLEGGTITVHVMRDGLDIYDYGVMPLDTIMQKLRMLGPVERKHMLFSFRQNGIVLANFRFTLEV